MNNLQQDLDEMEDKSNDQKKNKNFEITHDTDSESNIDD